MANTDKTKTVTCYRQVIGRDTHGCRWLQEAYETASRDAGRRARELRKAGFTVFVEGMGPQRTNDGMVNMSLLTVYQYDADRLEVPPVRTMRLSDAKF